MTTRERAEQLDQAIYYAEHKSVQLIEAALQAERDRLLDALFERVQALGTYQYGELLSKREVVSLIASLKSGEK